MAKVKGPLMSLEAAGQFGGELVFRRTGRGVAVYQKPARPDVAPSAAQRTVREEYRAIHQDWSALSEAQREGYRQQGRAVGLPGWNVYFMERKAKAEPPCEGGYDPPDLSEPVVLTAGYSAPALSVAVVVKPCRQPN
jgi:hypothetical protein